MDRYFPAACWATAMVLLASITRIGWVDHDAAMPLLMIMPLLAWVTIQGRGRCCARVQEA